MEPSSKILLRDSRIVPSLYERLTTPLWKDTLGAARYGRELAIPHAFAVAIYNLRLPEADTFAELHTGEGSAYLRLNGGAVRA